MNMVNRWYDSSTPLFSYKVLQRQAIYLKEECDTLHAVLESEWVNMPSFLKYNKHLCCLIFSEDDIAQ